MTISFQAGCGNQTCWCTTVVKHVHVATLAVAHFDAFKLTFRWINRWRQSFALEPMLTLRCFWRWDEKTSKGLKKGKHWNSTGSDRCGYTWTCFSLSEITVLYNCLFVFSFVVIFCFCFSQYYCACELIQLLQPFSPVLVIIALGEGGINGVVGFGPFSWIFFQNFLVWDRPFIHFDLSIVNEVLICELFIQFGGSKPIFAVSCI